jgi:hypothetical protein
MIDEETDRFLQIISKFGKHMFSKIDEKTHRFLQMLSKFGKNIFSK